MIGNCLDELGRREEAIELYKAALKAAIKRAPENSLLHFNLGVSLMRVGDGPMARKEMEQAVSLDPNHVVSHFFLARLYQSQGYRVPAVLAFSRFLLLEPQSSRVYAVMAEILGRTKPNGFAAKYYAPFVAEAGKQKLVNALVYRVFASAELMGAAEWKAANESDLSRFNEWLSGYRWP
jgi:tetratricopeptide (TPR) repeat protein